MHASRDFLDLAEFALDLSHMFPRGSSIYFYDTKKVSHFLELIVHEYTLTLKPPLAYNTIILFKAL